MRALTLVATTLLFWGFSAFAEEPSEHDAAAARALVSLVQLEEGPRVVAEQCKSVDPGGAKKRQALYDSWKVRHKALFKKIDGYAKNILPVLLVSAQQGKLDATATFRSQQAQSVRQEISGLPPAEKMKVCKNFAGAGFFNDERTDVVTKAAFDFLDSWRKERGEGAA